MKQNILSVVVGLVAAVITFIVIENINMSLYPAPKDLNFKNPEAVKSFMQNQPFMHWLMVLAGWFIGSFICGSLIRLISKSNNKKLPLIAGSILTLSGVLNFVLLPHPTWFIIAGMLIFIPATLIGYYLFNGTQNNQTL